MMTITKKEIVILAASSVISMLIIFMPKKRNVPGSLSYQVIQSTNGWGYEILVNNTVFIHQESIPGLIGSVGFNHKSSAEETARLIIRKLSDGKSPAISQGEMQPILKNDSISN